MYSPMCFVKNVIALILLLLLAIIPNSAKAQNISTLTGTFERITDIGEITNTDYVLIGAWAEYGNIRTFNLATSSFSSTYKKKLKALPYTNGAEKRIVCKDPMLVWNIKEINGYYEIISAESGKVLSRINNDGLGLQLKTYQDNSLSEWEIESYDSGTFVICHTKYGKRKLICDYPNDTEVCFDNYVEGEPLYIYKRISTNTPEDGTIDVPKNGTCVAIVVDAGSFSTDTPRTVSVEGFLLTDGTCAQDGAYSRFICQSADDDTKAFSLKSDDGTHYLSTDLTLTSEPVLWQVRDGKLVDYSSIDNMRYVCYNAASQQWLLLTKDEQKGQEAQFASLVAISPPPTSTYAEDGTMSLSGGWSANALSHLDFGDATSLDVTGAAIPLKARSFTNKPHTANFPIFIASDATSVVADVWDFVVVSDDSGCHLYKETQLSDKEMFYSPHDILLSNAQMTYTRKPLEGTAWQTICIPFAVSELPSNTLFYTAQELSDNELILQSVSHLEAGQPYLFRSKDEENGFSSTEVLVFKCDKGSLLGNPSNNNGLQGNYSQLILESGETNVFMLNPATSVFQRAAANSTLKPFRAFLRSANNTVKVRIIQ